jgi:hypothetical protein
MEDGGANVGKFKISFQPISIFFLNSFDSDSIDSEISEISDIFWYQNIGIDLAQLSIFSIFSNLDFFKQISHFLIVRFQVFYFL